VGQAGANDQQRLFDRLKQHTKDQLADRWSKFSWFGVRSVNNTGELRAEAAAAHPTLGDVQSHRSHSDRGLRAGSQQARRSIWRGCGAIPAVSGGRRSRAGPGTHDLRHLEQSSRLG
jgi:hypothetical protein